MGAQGTDFLATFNRIEKWLRDEMDNPGSMGFSELVRRLSKRSDLLVRKYHDDLLEIAQLRNAIVHDRISPDFIIAEPNEWVVNRLKAIETDLIQPESVIPRFEKYVTGFDKNVDLSDILSIIADKGYSQFPIYDNGKFLGLVTARGLGIWLASQGHNSVIEIKDKKVADVLASDRKRNNYRFIAQKTTTYQALEVFLKDPTIETILITKDGNPNGNLIGIIRPKDVFEKYYEEKGEGL